MADYSHLPIGDHVVEDTPDWQRLVHRSANGWSEELSWKPGREPTVLVNERTVRDRMQQALVANTTYLALATPTNAQNVAQINRLTRECSAIIRLLMSQLDDVSDT